MQQQQEYARKKAEEAALELKKKQEVNRKIWSFAYFLVDKLAGAWAIYTSPCCVYNTYQ